MNAKRLIVSDGLDGVGKGVFLEGVLDYFREMGLRIFDVHDFWKLHEEHPEFKNKSSQHFIDPESFDVYFTSEPTFVGIGKAIRFEITANNGRVYSAEYTANAYSMDREILFKRVHIPLQELGKIGVQSRSVSTSITYQPLQSIVQGENALTMEDIISLSGNKLALDWAPGLLMIPTITNTKDVISRLKGRKKDDDCKFENLDFQLKLKQLYEGEVLRNIFESMGTQVKYLDAGISVNHSRNLGYLTAKNYFETLKK